MGNAASRDDGAYVPPVPASTEADRRYEPAAHHVGWKLFGRDDLLTAVAVAGPTDLSRVVVDYLYVQAIDARTLIDAFSVDTIQIGPMALTRMMCPDVAMNVEAAVTAVLQGSIPYLLSADVLAVGTATRLLVYRSDLPPAA